MESTEQLAKRILDRINTKDGGTNTEKLAWIENSIGWHLDESFKLVKNINETSLNNLDRAKRLIEAEEKYGIPKTHLL